MKFLSEEEFLNFQTIEQDVDRLVYFKLISIGNNTLNNENRSPEHILNLIKKINGFICLPEDKEQLKGDVCQMIDKIYGK